MINTMFFKQMDLLLEVLPFVGLENNFALKGGTAINLFLRNLPRLSIDIDLTYTPIEDRDTSLKKISEGMIAIEENLKSKAGLNVIRSYLDKTPVVCKLLIQRKDVRIKLEINLVLRGHVYPCEQRVSCEKALGFFSREVTLRTLSFEDVYAGKLCAALDRQHPRDLFDVQMLMQNEGISDSLWVAFLVYLSSGDRPIHEMIAPNRIDIRSKFNNEFLDMSGESVSITELEQSREALIKNVNDRLKLNGADFLVSLLQGEPDWTLLNVAHANQLPGIKWKLLNIRKMNVQKQKEQLKKFIEIMESA